MKSYDVLVNGKVLEGLSNKQVMELSKKNDVKIIRIININESDYNSITIKKSYYD